MRCCRRVPGCPAPVRHCDGEWADLERIGRRPAWPGAGRAGANALWKRRPAGLLRPAVPGALSHAPPARRAHPDVPVRLHRQDRAGSLGYLHARRTTAAAGVGKERGPGLTPWGAAPVVWALPEVLLRARAIENQCYVVAAAQSGVHNPKRASYGHGMIVDPWGTVVAEYVGAVSTLEDAAQANRRRSFAAVVRCPPTPPAQVPARRRRARLCRAGSGPSPAGPHRDARGAAPASRRLHAGLSAARASSLRVSLS